eukprot:59730_1
MNKEVELLTAITESTNLEEKTKSTDDEYEVHDDDTDKEYTYNQTMIEYAYKACRHRIPHEERSTIMSLFETKEHEQLRENLIGYCNKTGQSYDIFNQLCNTANQYDTFESLQSAFPQTNQRTVMVCCGCCYSDTHVATFTVIGRVVLSNKLILKCDTLVQKAPPSDKDDREMKITQQIELNAKASGQSLPDLEDRSITIEVSENPYNVVIIGTGNKKELTKGDALSRINNVSIDDLDVDYVYKVLKHYPLSTEDDPFTITFERKDAKCTLKTCSSCCKSSKTEESTKSSKGTVMAVGLRMIKLMKLSLGIVSKVVSVLDTVTDAILLFKAATNDPPAILFTVSLVITLLSPYILSYSAGVQVFLYRKTFENIELLTFKSLLLGLYLFPTGIIYFILIDAMDILLQLYKWFAYGCTNKIKSHHELVHIESNVAEYFGMSRMDWLSFKKQKVITQLFFESLPQVILQSLLFTSVIKGRELLT